MLEQFYGDVLPRSGHYALFIGPTKQHVWASSIPDLVEKTLARSEQRDVYFATASFRAPVNRKAENVAFLRALRLDIDAGEAKHEKYGDAVYATQADALAGVIAFIKVSTLVPSYIVGSGAGLHVYFALDEDVLPDRWAPLARQLQACAVTHGLLVDATVTSDVARVLRPPGALHRSGARVGVLKATGRTYAYAQLVELLDVAPEPLARVYDTSVNDEVLREIEGPPKSVAKIIEHCAAMRHATSNPDVPEPFWRGMLGVVKHTVEGDEAAHRFSEDYAGYDYEETQAKLDNWKTGPTTCAEFGRHFDCSACPHFGKIKSPILLGTLTEVEIEALPPEQQPPSLLDVEQESQATTGRPWDGLLPAGYFVKEINGRETLCTKVKMKDTNPLGDDIVNVVTVPITTMICWLGAWSEAAGTGDYGLTTLHVWNGKVERIYEMDQSLLASQADLLKFLAGKSVVLLSTDTKAKKAMEEYLKSHFERIRELHKRPKISDRFGLRIQDEELTCAHGKYVIYPTGEIKEAMLGPGLRGEMAECFPLASLPEAPLGVWEPEVWTEVHARAKQYVEFLRKHYAHKGLETWQLAIMFGLASPLMPFIDGAYTRGSTLPRNGLTVSLFSTEGGLGKTETMRAIAVAFGHFKELVKAEDEQGSTVLARTRRASIHGTMPLFMDEMGNMNVEMMANLVSSIANANARARLTKSAEFQADASWALIALMATNRSQREMVAAANRDTGAIQTRLLELDIQNAGRFSPELSAQFGDDFAKVSLECAGALGAFLHLAYCKQGVEKMNKRVSAARRQAAELVGYDQGSRFQYRAFGCVLALQEILQALDMALFDTEALSEAFMKAHGAGKEFILHNARITDPKDMLSAIITSARPFTLITDTESNRRHNSTQRDVIRNSGGRPPNKVVARLIQKSRTLYIMSDFVRDWCKHNQAVLGTMVRECRNLGIIMPQRKDGMTMVMDLYKGTDEDDSTNTPVYKIDLSRLWPQEMDHENVVPFPSRQEPVAPAHDENGEAPRGA